MKLNDHEDVIILEQNVCVNVGPTTKNYYIGLGYDCKVGDLIIIPASHLKNGSRQEVWVQCPLCTKISLKTCRNIKLRLSTYCYGCKYKRNSAIKFSEKANIIHDYKYSYDNVEYKNAHKDVVIICPHHGKFLQRPNTHLNGSGCQKCSPVSMKSTSDFLEAAIKIHDNQYNYSLVDYKGYKLNILIICKTHGIFKQTPGTHLKGSGCPTCKLSKGELRILKFLSNKNISYKQQWNHKSLISNINGRLKFDFYLPDYHIFIEYDGELHFMSVPNFGGDSRLNKIKQNDQIKSQWASDNNYHLIRIPYWDFDNIEAILTKELNL